ncbi:serine hydrolase domain-containing protein [Massilia sp. DD77]|uniref:serine hydrolase domain-containing protein n=1 Tax=Massilia sp. DD77 TaxID=3109349 RepID=UPI002FFF2F27
MKAPALLLALPLAAAAVPPAPVPASVPLPAAHADALPAALDALVAARFKPELPGVAALVLKDGKPLLRKGYGMASVELGVPVRPEHVFRIGSTTKLFTATAILLLADEGRLALDAPVARYLADAPPQWSKVTLLHLLTHTSGIPNLSMDSGYWRTTARLDHQPEELVAPVRVRPLDFEAGERFAYNNTGYNLLGLVIEKVSAQGYYEFVDARIARPLGLKHTVAGDDRQLIPGLVSGYQLGPKPARILAASNLYAAGGLVSTVDDLASFMLALQAGRIVSPASVARMNASHVLPNGEATGYGLGTWGRRVNGKRLVGHGGYILNFYSQLEMAVDSGIVAVTLHNGDRFGGDNEELSKRLIAAVQAAGARTAN